MSAGLLASYVVWWVTYFVALVSWGFWPAMATAVTYVAGLGVYTVVYLR